MAVQGIWSGTISFSLVAIPVRLVKASNLAVSLFTCSTKRIILASHGKCIVPKRKDGSSG